MTGRLVIVVLLGVFTLQTEYIYAIAVPLEKTADPKIDKSLIFNSTMDDSSNDDRPPSISNGEDKPEVGEKRSESSVALTRKKRGQKFGEVPDYTVLHNPPTKPICLNCQYEAKPSLHNVPDYTVLHNPPTKPICLNCQYEAKPSLHNVPDYTVLHNPPTKPICLNCQYEAKPSLHNVLSYPLQILNPSRPDQVNPSPRNGPGYPVVRQPTTRNTCPNCRYEVNTPPQHDVSGYPVQNVHPTRHHEVTPSPRYGPGNRWLYETSKGPLAPTVSTNQHHITYPSYEHSKGPNLYKVQPLNHPSIVY